MDRIKTTEGTSVVQMQKALAQKTIQPETEQTSQVRFLERLALKQQQSLAMVQIMLHVSVSSLFIVILVLLPGPNSGLLSENSRGFLWMKSSYEHACRSR